MIEHFLSQLKKVGRGIELGAQRQREIKEEIVSFMKHNPVVRMSGAERHQEQASSFSIFSKSKSMPIFAGVAIMALLGGGVSFAAEGALPGDLLYPIKVQVNEEVRGVFSFSPEAKTVWEEERVTRRLEEATQLALERQEVKVEVYENLESRFDEHAQKVEDRIQKMREDGDEEKAGELATRFEASLKAHENILRRLETRSSSSIALRLAPSILRVQEAATRLEDVREVLRNKFGTSSTTTTDVRSTTSLKLAAQARLKVVLETVSSTQGLFRERGDRLTTDTKDKVESKIFESVELAGKAQVSFDKGEYSDSYKLSGEALLVIREAQALMNFDYRLKLKVRLPDILKKASGTIRSDGNGSKIEVEVEDEGDDHKGKSEVRVKVENRINSQDSDEEDDDSSSVRDELRDRIREVSGDLKVKLGL